MVDLRAELPREPASPGLAGMMLARRVSIKPDPEECLPAQTESGHLLPFKDRHLLDFPGLEHPHTERQLRRAVLENLRGPRRGARLAPAALAVLHAHIPSSAMTNSPPGQPAPLSAENILRQFAGLAEANTGATKISIDDVHDNNNADKS